MRLLAGKAREDHPRTPPPLIFHLKEGKGLEEGKGRINNSWGSEHFLFVLVVVPFQPHPNIQIF